MSAEFSVLVSFVIFFMLFAWKIYPLLVQNLDEYIESIRKKIHDVQSLQKRAEMSLNHAYGKQGQLESAIEDSRRRSEERIRHIHEENEKCIMALEKRHKEQLQAQLESELIRQRDLLIERLSDVIIDKLEDKMKDAKSLPKINKKDLENII